MCASLASPVERSLTITRIFDAPRNVVFRAWTDPQQMTRWFGPRCFTNSDCELDVRAGGAWRIVMVGPGGSQHPCGGVYKEVVPNVRLVFSNDAFAPDGTTLLEGHTTVHFEDLDGKTKLTLETRAVGRVAFAEQMLAGMEPGWNQTLDRLGETVATAGRDIFIERVFNAPRNMVFSAWTDPKHIASWWGPRGFTNTIHSMDVRPGGEWKFTMHGPDGIDYENTIVYIDVAPPERLVYKHGGESLDSGPQFEVTITMTEEGPGKTRVSLLTVLPTAAARDKVVKEHNAIEGGNQTLQRFGEFLDTRLRITTPTDREIVMTRVFRASPRLVFDAWTKPEFVTRWWGFRNSTLSTCEIDCRPGGHWRYVLDMQGGHQMTRHGVFQEVAPPGRLVYTDTFVEPKLGNPEWLTTVLFEPAEGGTLVTSTCLHASKEHRDGHLNSGLEGGLTQIFDRLETLLGEIQ